MTPEQTLQTPGRGKKVASGRASAPLTEADILAARRRLSRADPRLRPWLRRIPTPTLTRPHTAYASLCRAVVAQQVSNGAAKAICARLFAGAPARGPSPARLRALSDTQLRSIGLSRQKVAYVRGLSEAFDAGGPLHRYPFAHRSDPEIIEALTALHGIGRWSAEMFLIFWLHRPDVFAPGDLALRNGLSRVEGKTGLSPAQCERLAQRWAPHRTVASLYLWRIAHWK